MKKYRLNIKKFNEFIWGAIATLGVMGIGVGVIFAILTSPEW